MDNTEIVENSGTENISVPEIVQTEEKIQEIEGVKTALIIIDSAVVRLISSVNNAKNAHKLAEDDIAETKKDARTVRMLQSINADWEKMTRDNATISAQKSVSSDVGIILQNIDTVQTHINALALKYGAVVETVKTMDLEATGDITDAVKNKILTSPEYAGFRTKFSPTFKPIGGGLYKIYGTGHNKGNKFQSNLRNWN